MSSGDVARGLKPSSQWMEPAVFSCDITYLVGKPGAMAAKKNHLADLLTITQAARLLGVTRQTISAAVKRGRIKARKVGHVSLISSASIKQYKKTRKPAPPRKHIKRLLTK